MPVKPTSAQLLDAIDTWKAEAYVVIGQLLGDRFGTPEAERALDYFSSDAVFPDGSILSYEAPKAESVRETTIHECAAELQGMARDVRNGGNERFIFSVAASRVLGLLTKSGGAE